MEIGKCKDCKFWKKEIHWEPYGNHINPEFYICHKSVLTPKNGKWGCAYWKEKK